MARISDNEQPRKGAEPAGRSAGAGTVHEPRIVPADNHGVPPAAHTAGHLGGGLPVCRPRFSVFALAAQLFGPQVHAAAFIVGGQQDHVC